MKLSEMNASQLNKMLREKKCSSVEIFTDVKNSINEKDDKIKAYLTINDDAIEIAKKVDELIAKGENIPPLAGIPISIKDNISTKGIKTTCSSKMLENYVPPFNATVVENINKNLMPVIGKTNMDEFAMGSSTETSYFQITANPKNTECVPGGSSGGAAASVSADETILAIGSDTGGSIRQPAAFCGVVGLKPTYGSVSRYGLVAFASSLDQIGPLTKSVEDAALLQDVIASNDVMDATSCKNEYYGTLAKNLKNNLKGLRIGIPKEYFGEGIDTEIRESVFNSIKLLESNGAELVDISLPSTKYAINTYYILASAEASSNLSRFDGVRYGFRASNYENLNDMYVKTRSQGFGDEVKRRIMLGTFVLSSGFYDAYYKKAKRTQKLIIDEFNQAFKNCDVIATPTTPTTAFKIGENINDPIKMYYNDVCTVPVNIAGLPAISVPCAYSKNNLPISLQIIGNRFDEQKILNTAYSFENILGGFDKLRK